MASNQPMSAPRELARYVSVGAGMALATCSFTVVAGLFEVVSTPWAVAAIVLAGLGAMAVSGSVAELASIFPSAAGIRTYLKAAFGDRVSMVFVFLYLIFVVAIAGVESFVFALVMQATFPQVSVVAVILGLLVTVVGLNLLGLDLPLTLQLVLTTLLVLAITGLGLGGLAFGAAGPAAETATAASTAAATGAATETVAGGLSSLPGAVGMAVFLFIGFEWVVPLGRNREAYARLIPLSMPLAIGLNTVMYCLFTLGLAAAVATPVVVASSVPQVELAGALLGSAGTYLALAMSCLAILSTFNAGLMGGARLLYALAREGRMPAWCARISLRTGAPVAAILLLAGLATASSALVLLYRLELVAAVVGSALLCWVYAALVLAGLSLRRTQPQRKRPFRNPLPKPLQGLLAGLLPLVGAGTLVSQPETPWAPLVAAGGAVLLALVLTLLLTPGARAGGRPSSPPSPPSSGPHPEVTP